MTKTIDALVEALEALETIALAGMSGSGQESEEGMRAWHARRAWEFIGIAARAKEKAAAALAQARAEQAEPVAFGDERSLFTSWLLTQGWVESPSARENGTYINGQVQARWHAWRARADLATPPAAPVAKLEPLSDAELKELAVSDEFLLYCDQDEFNEIARAIEAAHNAKLGNK